MQHVTHYSLFEHASFAVMSSEVVNYNLLQYTYLYCTLHQDYDKINICRDRGEQEESDPATETFKCETT